MVGFGGVLANAKVNARPTLRLRVCSLILAFDAVGDDMDYMMSYIFCKV